MSHLELQFTAVETVQRCGKSANHDHLYGTNEIQGKTMVTNELS